MEKNFYIKVVTCILLLFPHFYWIYAYFKWKCVFFPRIFIGMVYKKKLPKDFSVVTRLYLLSLGSVHCPLNISFQNRSCNLRINILSFALFMFTFGFWNHYVNCPFTVVIRIWLLFFSLLFSLFFRDNLIF